MRILVLRGGALGDFLVTLPALRALRSRWPEAEIILVGNRAAADLGVLDGTLNQALDQNAARWAPLFDSLPLPTELQEWMNGFDLVVNYWPDPDGVLSQHLQQTGATVRCGSAQVSAAPAARHFLQPLETLVGKIDELAPVIRWPESVRDEAAARVRPLGQGFVALHPGSGGTGKLWPLERWHGLAQRLQRPVLWITGEAEPWARPPPEVDHVAACSWPLPVLGAALSLCGHYIGHDTGVTHLAAAAGAQGLALFGPTDPQVWAPPTPRFRVLRAGGGDLRGITIDDVETALRALPPSPAATQTATA